MLSKRESHKRGPLILSIGGGKGGVGKSMISGNLASQFALAGMKVVLLDLDFGAANLHTLFGIRQPNCGLGDYFTTPRSQLANYLMRTEIENLLLVPGSGFVPELANLKHMQKVKLIKHIKRLDADLVLLDLGAGSANNVVDFFSMTQVGMIVTTPEPTAVVNAYEFLKNVVYRILFRMFRSHDKLLKIIKTSTLPNNKLRISTIAELIEEVGLTHEWAARNIEAVCEDLDLYIIFNQARKYHDANLGLRLRDICHKHLNLDLNFAGIVFFNEAVSASVFSMRPISLESPQCTTSKTLKTVATNLMNHIVSRKIKGAKWETFQQQFSRVMANARSDFEKNLIEQKIIERKRIKQYLPEGDIV